MEDKNLKTVKYRVMVTLRGKILQYLSTHVYDSEEKAAAEVEKLRTYQNLPSNRELDAYYELITV